MHPFTSTYRRLTLIGIFMVVSMLAARKALLLTGASWEYAAFLILYFAIVAYAKILDENEMNIIGEIRKDIRYNIGVRIPHIFKIVH
jgi:hypothetical protein